MAVVVRTQQARLARKAAAVELHALVGVGIDTDADQTLDESGLERAHQAIGPFFGLAVALAAWLVGVACTAVAPAVLVVALVIDRPCG